jgi:hypothetical protein
LPDLDTAEHLFAEYPFPRTLAAEKGPRATNP